MGNFRNVINRIGLKLRADFRADQPKAPMLFSAPPPEIAPRVLGVDDNASQRAIIATLVADLGWGLSAAENGAEGVATCANAGPFDLIPMDYRMPVMDGGEATRKIRALGGWAASVPIIGATADWNPALHRWCLQAGMTECVAKPVQPLALAELMRRTLSPLGRIRNRAAG